MSLLELTPTAVADRVVLTSARLVTRRRFLRNAGAVALSMTLGGRYFVASAFGQPSECYDIQGAYACYDSHGPCGPSPICPTGTCSSNGLCYNYYRRPHNKFSCDMTGTVANLTGGMIVD